MPTKDERREIAAKLRECSGLHEFAEIFGFSWDDESDWYWRDVAVTVADLIEPELERTVETTEAVDAICGQMCGDGWDWHNRAEAVVKTVAEMCGAKVVEERAWLESPIYGLARDWDKVEKED